MQSSNLKKIKIIYTLLGRNQIKLHIVNNSGMFRSTMREHPAKCNVEFTKLRKNTFFLLNIFTIKYCSLILHRISQM